jgi:nucleoside-diphosphate-sugar epimerase
MKNILITGSQGYMGNLLLQKCAAKPLHFKQIVALDIRLPYPMKKIDINGVEYIEEDIRSENVSVIIERYQIDVR